MRKKKRTSVRLGSRRRVGIYLVGVGLWFSGGLWLLFHYFFKRNGEFGPEVHPAEPWLLKLHGAFAFASIWLFGLLWGLHITIAWPFGRRRWSGAVMTGLLFWLTVSGYLLYYSGNETARSVLSILHWSMGIFCPAVFLWHRIKRRKRVTPRDLETVEIESGVQGNAPLH